MNNELYRKLVDLYAGSELPEDLEREMEQAATQDESLAYEMKSLRNTVETLHALPAPEFTEESCQRILMRLYARGAEIQQKAPEPAHLQYFLPMQG